MSNNNAEWGAVTSAQAGASSADGAQTETGEPNVLAVVEALNAENSQLKDRVLRTLAEMENLRRRTEREVSDAKTYGATSFARDMLTVVDNLSRALEHLPPEARASADPSTRSLIEGVELTARDLEAALGRHGVRSSTPRARGSIPTFTRRFSRRLTRPFLPAQSRRWSRAAGRLAIGSCARQWLASPRVGRRPRQGRSRRRRRVAAARRPPWSPAEGSD